MLGCATASPVVEGGSIEDGRATDPQADAASPDTGPPEDLTFPGAGLAGEHRWVVLTRPDATARVPQDIPEGAGRPYDDEVECGGTAERVVLTTYGGPRWQAHPVVVDGWLCPDGRIQLPARLPPTLLAELVTRGVDAAHQDAHDEAEVYFRRVLAQAPRHGPTRLNLASLYLDRAGAELDGDARPEVLSVLLSAAATELERAIAGNPPAPPVASLILGRVYLRAGETGRAREILDAMLAHPNLDAALAAEARAMLTSMPGESPANGDATAHDAAAERGTDAEREHDAARENDAAPAIDAAPDDAGSRPDTDERGR